MTDISDRVTNAQETRRDNGEYEFQLIDAIPFLGLAHYEHKCPTIPPSGGDLFDKSVTDSERRDILMKRTNRSFGLWFYNGTLTMMTMYLLF